MTLETKDMVAITSVSAIGLAFLTLIVSAVAFSQSEPTAIRSRWMPIEAPRGDLECWQTGRPGHDYLIECWPKAKAVGSP